MQLVKMFYKRAKQERYEVVKALTSCKIKEGGCMCAHVQQIKCYIESLENLDVVFDENLAVDLVLGSNFI